MASIFFVCAYSIILDIDNPENENKVAVKIKSSFIRMVKIMSKKHIPDLSCLMANLLLLGNSKSAQTVASRLLASLGFLESFGKLKTTRYRLKEKP
jgi:hypothetical protein